MKARQQGSLFERLAGGTCERTALSDATDVSRSIAAQLCRMLSTRAGSVQTLPDYGLPDLNDMNKSTHEALTDARRAIEKFIQKYEPRLAGASVTFRSSNSNSLKLEFMIKGVVDAGGGRHAVEFSAELGREGRVLVRAVTG